MNRRPKKGRGDVPELVELLQDEDLGEDRIAVKSGFTSSCRKYDTGVGDTKAFCEFNTMVAKAPDSDIADHAS